MKKTTKLAALLAAVALVGGGVLYAQEADYEDETAAEAEATETSEVAESDEEEADDEIAEEEAVAEAAPAEEKKADDEIKPEWKVSGFLATGVTANFDEPSLIWYNNDLTNRIRLNFNYTYGNVGVKGRVHFQGQSYKAKVTTTSDDSSYTSTYSNGFVDPQLIYGFGWANLFDDKLELQAGRLFTNEFSANNIGYGLYGDGVSAVVKPIDGLSLGVKVYVSNSGTDTITPETFFYTNALYGIAYEHDLFSIAVGYGREAYTGTADSLVSGITVNPIDQLSILWENDIWHLAGFDGGTRDWLSNLVVDITPLDPLFIELIGTTDLTLSDTVTHETYIEGFVSYDINDDFTCDVGGGVKLATDEKVTVYVRPGVTYHMSKKADVGLHYAYDSGASAYYLTGANSTGNEVQLDFVWKF